MGVFSADISAFVAKVKGNADLVVRKVALDLFTRVIVKSPVDTGRFKGNWQVAIANLPSGTVAIDDKAGTVTISKAQAEVLKMKAGDVIHLVNNLPYARKLEYGHSKQAPAGMVRVTLQEFQAIVTSAAAEVPK